MNYKNIKKLSDIFFVLFSLIIVFLGIYIRSNLYFSDVPLWHDEILLAQSILRQNLIENLTYLLEIQKAPPFFVFFSQLNTIIWGINGKILHLIPFISGICSIIAFYFLLKQVYKSKITILTGLILFSLNVALVYYSSEFKPYSSDVLICILLLLSYNYIDFKDITLRRSILFSIVILISILSSIPSLFVVPAVLLGKIIEQRIFNSKLLVLMSGYIIGALYIIIMFKELAGHENKALAYQFGFINFSISSINLMFTDFFNFFHINVYSGIIFFLVGLIIFLKKYYNLHLILVLFFAIIASLLRIYPLTGRVILYLVPVVIIFMIRPIEFVQKYKYAKYKFLSILMAIVLSIILLFSLNKTDYFNYKSYMFWMSYDNRVKIVNDYKMFFDNYKNNDFVFMNKYFENYFIYYNKSLQYDFKIKYRVTFYDVTEQQFYEDLESYIKRHENLLSRIWLCLIIDEKSSEKVEELIKKRGLKYIKYHSNHEMFSLFLINDINYDKTINQT